jgi:V/A-type H+/Na+-transporting ATPase subunit C
MEPFSFTDFSGDTRYGQAVARVRVLEQRLITKRRMVRMTDARSSEAFLDELRGTDIADHIVRVVHPEQVPAAFEEIGDQRLHLLQELGIPRDILRVIEAWRRISAAKRDLRLQHAGTPSAGRTDLTRFGGDGQSWNGTETPSGPSGPPDEAFVAAAADFQRSGSLFRFDMLIERAFSIYLREAFHEHAASFIRHLVRHYLDLHAVASVFRWRTWIEDGAPGGRLAGRIDSQLLSVPGFLSADLLQSAAQEHWERLAALFQYTPYEHVVQEGVQQHQKTGSWWYLEKLSDDYLTSFCRLARYTPFGIEPLVAYGWFLWQEARNVRMVVTARQAGIAAEHIIPRLREGYDA